MLESARYAEPRDLTNGRLGDRRRIDRSRVGYYFAGADKGVAIAPIVGAIATLTQPVMSAVLTFDPAARVSLYDCALAKAVGYALVGMFVEWRTTTAN